MSTNHAFSETDISFLKQAKLQAQVLVPVLRAIRERLGKAEADQLVASALRDWSVEQFRRISASASGKNLDNWQSIWTDVFEKIDDGLELDMLRNDEQAQDFNVTRCPYAEFFNEIDEPDLGELLLCEQDVHLADQVGGGAVEFERTQTIMGGAKYCDFRIRMNRDADS